MTEFAGYIGNQYPPTDWGKIGTNLLQQFDQENQRRKEEKEKIDNDYADSFAKIGEYEQTTDQDVNEFIYKGVDEIRNGIKTQYDLLKKGAITMADYKLYKNTAMSDWSNLNKAVKGFGATIAASQKLITEGKMSGLGQYNSLNFAKLGDLKTAKIMINPQTGRIYRANIDPVTGKIASPNDVYSPSAMINPGNLVDLKVDLDSQIDPFLKRLETVGVAKNLGNGVIQVDESARNNPAFKTALDAQVNAVTATPRSTTSILTDYIGDYQFFESEAQKKELIAKGTPADRLIQVKRKNGIAEPILTEQQEATAKEFVRNQIEVGVGGKETMTRPNKPSGGGGASGMTPLETWAYKKTITDEEKALAEAKKEAKIMAPKVKLVQNVNKLFTTTNPGDFAILKQAASKLKKWKKVSINNSGNDVIIYGVPEKGTSSTPPKELARFSTPQQLAAFMSGESNLIEAESDFAATMDYMLANDIPVNVKSFAPKPKPTPAPTPAPKPAGNMKIVPYSMVLQKLGKNANQADIDAYIKQLESSGNFKVERK